MKRFFFAFIVSFLLYIPAFSNQEIIQNLNSAKKEIANKKYSTAIYKLTNIIHSLKEFQKKEIERFFPKIFNAFRTETQTYQLGDLLTQSEHIGVLFSKHYRDKSDRTIDINVVFMDPSIEEYINIINNPDLIENLENTNIIKINNQYSAIEKFMPDEHYCERNIIITNDTLLNIIANGIADNRVIDEFCQSVKFADLESFLSN